MCILTTILYPCITHKFNVWKLTRKLPKNHTLARVFNISYHKTVLRSPYLVNIYCFQGELSQSFPPVSVTLWGWGHASNARLTPSTVLEIHDLLKIITARILKNKTNSISLKLALYKFMPSERNKFSFDHLSLTPTLRT